MNLHDANTPAKKRVIAFCNAPDLAKEQRKFAIRTVRRALSRLAKPVPFAEDALQVAEAFDDGKATVDDLAGLWLGLNVRSGGGTTWDIAQAVCGFAVSPVATCGNWEAVAVGSDLVALYSAVFNEYDLQIADILDILPPPLPHPKASPDADRGANTDTEGDRGGGKINTINPFSNE